MICPQTQAECHNPLCTNKGFSCKPPPPTLAEIERLVLALRQSSYDLGEFVEGNASRQLVSKAREIDEQNCAALIAAIQQLGVK